MPAHKQGILNIYKIHYTKYWEMFLKISNNKIIIGFFSVYAWFANFSLNLENTFIADMSKNKNAFQNRGSETRLLDIFVSDYTVFFSYLKEI